MNVLLFLAFSNLNLPYNGKVLSYGTSFSAKEAPENLFWNPAGMKGEAYVVSAFNCSGLILGSLGKLWDRESFSLGLGIQLMNSGKMIKREEDGDSIGIFNYQFISPFLGGKIRIKRANLGMRVLFPYTYVDEYNSFGLAMDLGLIYSFKEEVIFSFCVKNLGREINPFLVERERFLREYRFGGILKFGEMDFSFEYSSIFTLCSSISYNFNKDFSLIIGYNGEKKRFEEVNSYILSGFSFAGDIKCGKIRFCIGSVFSEPLGLSTLASISLI
ncbi:MAG: hypothetical protein ABIN61_06200 [candidate division WOR-3 bacterium]